MNKLKRHNSVTYCIVSKDLTIEGSQTINQSNDLRGLGSLGAIVLSHIHFTFERQSW
jgi:hypothetical protein